MEIFPDHKYILYRVVDDFDTETHIVLDLTSSFPSLSALATLFVQTAKQMPPAFSWQLETTARLEEEAFILLGDFAIDSALDDWDEDEAGKYDIIDRLTGKPFDSTAELALLTGQDLSRLDLHPARDSWPFPYQADIVFRSGEEGRTVFVRPVISAEADEGGRRYVEFTSSGGRLPWERLERALTSFMASGE